MQVHENLSELTAAGRQPAFLFVCQVGDAIRLVEISGPDEIPTVEKWLVDAGQWHSTKGLGLYQLVGTQQQQSSAPAASGATNATGNTEAPRRRGRPPRDAQQTSTAGVVAGGVDPGPLEDDSDNEQSNSLI